MRGLFDVAKTTLQLSAITESFNHFFQLIARRFQDTHFNSFSGRHRLRTNDLRVVVVDGRTEFAIRQTRRIIIERVGHRRARRQFARQN